MAGGARDARHEVNRLRVAVVSVDTDNNGGRPGVLGGLSAPTVAAGAATVGAESAVAAGAGVDAASAGAVGVGAGGTVASGRGAGANDADAAGAAAAAAAADSSSLMRRKRSMPDGSATAQLTALKISI